MRANLYRTPDITDESVEQIRHGIELLSEYVGAIVVNKVAEVRLPMNDGKVNFNRVGYGKLDKLVDIHLFTAPYIYKPEVLEVGLSYYGKGIAWVKATPHSHTTSLTAAHEVAHSLGFVTRNRDSATSGGHCENESCMMFPKGSGYSLQDIERAPSGFKEKMGSMLGKKYFTQGLMKHTPKPCDTCSEEMDRLIDRNLSIMRMDRLVYGFPSPR